MLTCFKILSSVLTLLFITAIAKKNSVLAGFVAVLPINILLSIFWIYFENKNLMQLQEFANAACIGLLPTMVFVLVLSILFSKNYPLNQAIFVGMFFLSVISLLGYGLFSQS